MSYMTYCHVEKFYMYMANCQLEFAAIYAVLLQNLICRNLRAFAWRKIGPKIVSVEKKGEV